MALAQILLTSFAFLCVVIFAFIASDKEKRESIWFEDLIGPGLGGLAFASLITSDSVAKMSAGNFALGFILASILGYGVSRVLMMLFIR